LDKGARSGIEWRKALSIGGSRFWQRADRRKRARGMRIEAGMTDGELEIVEVGI
jgi:hypothetical protein